MAVTATSPCSALIPASYNYFYRLGGLGCAPSAAGQSCGWRASGLPQTPTQSSTQDTPNRTTPPPLAADTDNIIIIIAITIIVISNNIIVVITNNNIRVVTISVNTINTIITII
jgi:hypothetical protein